MNSLRNSLNGLIGCNRNLMPEKLMHPVVYQ